MAKKLTKRSCEKFLLLAVLCSCLLPLSLLLNFKGRGSGAFQAHRKFARSFPQPSQVEHFPAPHLYNLVLVAGHSVFVGSDYTKADDSSLWYLEDYQKVEGETQSFFEHIKLGVEAAAKDPHSLLLFSGGETRTAAGPRSEGLSYWQVANAKSWFGKPDVQKRAFLEEHARDSYENLLFSMCRFYELTGHYPNLVTVVSYSIKQSRFNDLHRNALRFPKRRFNFIGTPVPAGAQHAEMGEYRTVQQFRENLYGCTGELLKKRLARDPFAMGPPDPSRCPALEGLLHWCSATELYPGQVPW